MPTSARAKVRRYGVAWPNMATYWPEPSVSRGQWRAEWFTLSKDEVDFIRLRDEIHGRRLESLGLEPGQYLKLMRGRSIVMSNTPMELFTNTEAVESARGRVLLGGLGLGIVLAAILETRPVTAVTVVEIDADLLALAAPRFKDHRVTFVNADVTRFTVPAASPRYDAVYFDIWDDVPTTDDRDTINRLRRCGRGWLAPGGWIGSWRAHDAR